MPYLLLIGKERKKGKKREKRLRGFTPPRADMPYWQCHAWIFLAVSTIKSCFKG
jgi:hypothetical protein